MLPLWKDVPYDQRANPRRLQQSNSHDSNASLNHAAELANQMRAEEYEEGYENLYQDLNEACSNAANASAASGGSSDATIPNIREDFNGMQACRTV